MYNSLNEAIQAAEDGIASAAHRLIEIEKSFENADSEAKKKLIEELNQFRDYFECYEYFCVNDGGHDSSAYVTVHGDEDSSYWTLAGVPCHFIANPVPKFAEKILMDLGHIPAGKNNV